MKGGREQRGLQHALVSCASPAFAIAPSHPAATNVLEAETGASDPERLHAAA